MKLSYWLGARNGEQLYYYTSVGSSKTLAEAIEKRANRVAKHDHDVIICDRDVGYGIEQTVYSVHGRKLRTK